MRAGICYLLHLRNEETGEMETGFVAKESRFEEEMGDAFSFHCNFQETQQIAARLALQFSQRLAQHKGAVEFVFVTPVVISVDDANFPKGKRTILCEPRLEGKFRETLQRGLFARKNELHALVAPNPTIAPPHLRRIADDDARSETSFFL